MFNFEDLIAAWRVRRCCSPFKVGYSNLIPLTSEHKCISLSDAPKMMYKDMRAPLLALQVFSHQQKKSPGNQIAMHVCEYQQRASFTVWLHKRLLNRFCCHVTCIYFAWKWIFIIICVHLSGYNRVCMYFSTTLFCFLARTTVLTLL